MKNKTSFFKLKCPICNEGSLFERQGLFVYRDILKMPDCCDHCGLKFEKEPGFWIGALWTSYPIVVVLETPFLIGAVFYPKFPFAFYMIAMIVVFLVFYPVMLRLGRSAWIKLNNPV